MDPRINVIDRRLAGIKKIIAVSGGKGGVGKSTIAVTLALALSEAGYKVGLLDLDFWGPCAHILLGAEGVYPQEEKGIVPPKVCGIKFMSIIYYTADKTLALRRAGYADAVIELLAVTQWGPLDYLIIDMPPGIGDAALDVIRSIKKISFCLIVSPSRVVLETVKKTLKMLQELRIPVIGVIENMKTGRSSVKEEMERFNIPFLGEIDLDPGLEDAVGSAKRLLETDFAKSINKIFIRKECQDSSIGAKDINRGGE